MGVRVGERGVGRGLVGGYGGCVGPQPRMLIGGRWLGLWMCGCQIGPVGLGDKIPIVCEGWG